MNAEELAVKIETVLWQYEGERDAIALADPDEIIYAVDMARLRENYIARLVAIFEEERKEHENE